MSMDNPYTRPMDASSGEIWSKGANFIRGIGEIAVAIKVISIDTYHDFRPTQNIGTEQAVGSR